MDDAEDPLTDPEVAVRLPRSMWRTLLDNQPTNLETYTPLGARIFAVYQQIQQQVDGVPVDPPKER